MTVCPIAIAVGCRKCPVFAVCPLKTVIGDYRPDQHPQTKSGSASKSKRERASK